MNDEAADSIENNPYSQALIAVSVQATVQAAMFLRLGAVVAGRLGMPLEEFVELVQEIGDDNPEHGSLFSNFKPNDEVRRAFSVIDGGKTN